MNFFTYFKYSFLSLFRDKMTFFWNTIFPIIISSFFILIFSNFKTDFKKVDIAMKDSNPYISFVKENVPILNIKKPSYDIKKDLENKKYKAFIDDDLTIEIFKYDEDVSIVKNVFDTFKQISNSNLDFKKLSENLDLKFIDVKEQNFDLVHGVIYSIIIMTSLYTAFYSTSIINGISIGQSNFAKRILISPIKKIRYVFIKLFSSLCIAVLNIALLILFVKIVFNIDVITDFPSSIILIFLTMLFGFSIGMFVSTFIKSTENIQMSIILSIIMLLCYTSGMLGHTTTNFILDTFPIIRKINPAIYLQNAFISVNMIGCKDYLLKACLCSLSITTVLFLLSVIKLRREYV